MKKIISILIIAILIFISIGSANAQYVKGYSKKNGTYVNGYNRTNSNSTKKDNYSTKGNTNPYTGKKGYK